MTNSATDEIARGQRFAFGRNWSRFLTVLSEQRVRVAEASLRSMLEVDHLNGKSFLDVGSGSGLFSLAARRLGARVRSFDYDPQSVECTRELKSRYFPNDAEWLIEQGSVLDAGFVQGQGEFDVVYSWGVLHHTGDMWRALENASLPVGRGGRLYIAIYNDQGAASRRWLRAKRLYCSGVAGRAVTCAMYIPYFVVSGLLADARAFANPLRRYTAPTTRGMSVFHDWFDWLGGLPFEVAKPEAIIKFYRDHDFTLQNLVTVGGGSGNNEFVFERR